MHDLLSRDRNFDQQLHVAGSVPVIGALQLSLGLLDIAPMDVPLRRPKARPVSTNGEERAYLDGFARRLEATGASPKTRAAYTFQLAQLLAAGRRHGLGAGDGLVALFRDEYLLGLALTDDASEHRGQLSRWTLAQRRAAIRSFVRLMSPELRPHLPDAPETIVMRALRRVAERVGGGYRLTGGSPRRRGGRAPTPDEIAAIIRQAATASEFKGPRNCAFLVLLYETGSRVNALRSLTGDAVQVMPGGHKRLRLHAKGCSAPREVELSDRAAGLLDEYLAAFNLWATVAGRCERIVLGEPGPVWRSSWTTQWAYKGVVEAFERACLAAGTHAYTLHALRRGFATQAASTLPRHVVARAGGWRGLERLDNHYIRPREETIFLKLGYGPRDTQHIGEQRDAAATL